MEIDNVLREQLSIAPNKIKQILLNKSWLKVTEEISGKNSLLKEQGETLENEILFVLLGMEYLSDLIQNIRINVGLTEEKAHGIAQEAMDKIFKSIENLLPKADITEKPVESKEEALQRLKEKMMGGSVRAPDLVPKANLPMVELGEKVHDVPHIEVAKPIVSTPAPVQPQSIPFKPEATTPPPNYSTGKDPYREPIE